MAGKAQILQRKRITAVVRKTAGLRTFSTVSASSPNDRAHKTLPGSAHTESPVYKHFGFYRRVITKIRNVHPYEEPAIDIVPLLDEEDFE